MTPRFGETAIAAPEDVLAVLTYNWFTEYVIDQTGLHDQKGRQFPAIFRQATARYPAGFLRDTSPPAIVEPSV